MESTPNVTPDDTHTTRQLLFRNTGILLIAKVLATPIAIGVNAVMARFLGAEGYGHIYLAATFCSFGFLLVSWGQSGSIPALLATERANAGGIFGSALAWRAVSAIVVTAGLSLLCLLLGYPAEFQIILGLTSLSYLIVTIYGTCQDMARGFERTELDAYASVFAPILTGIVVLPVLFLFRDLRLVLAAQVVADIILLVLVWRGVRRLNIGALSVHQNTVKNLLAIGWPFLFSGVAMAIQPNIDAVFLSKLAPSEVVGWHAASRKLIGLVVFPASALVTALYPVLCRLNAENPESFRNTARDALSACMLLVFPLALGCALFPDIGVRILSKEQFEPAENNIRILAAFVFLLYFSMPLGGALLAAGKSRPWILVQCAAILVTLALDPLLVPWFQAKTGNGGLGICTAMVASETAMVAGGLWLVPRGILNRTLLKSLFQAAVAGLSMGAVAWLLKSFDSWLVAPLAVLAYLVSLWLLGALKKEQIAAVRAMISRKARRT